MNPPVGYGSSKPSCAKRSNASRIGVRETPTRLARGASESRSPGANSPFRIISRTHSSVRAICESASDVTLGEDTVSLSPTLKPPAFAEKWMQAEWAGYSRWNRVSTQRYENSACRSVWINGLT